MRKRFVGFGVLLMGVVLAAPSDAALITFTAVGCTASPGVAGCTSPGTPAINDVTPEDAAPGIQGGRKTDFADTLLIPEFNPALGILQSVRLAFQLTADSTLTLTGDPMDTGFATTSLYAWVWDADNVADLAGTAPGVIPNFEHIGSTPLLTGSASTGVVTLPVAPIDLDLDTGVVSNLYTLALILSEFTDSTGPYDGFETLNVFTRTLTSQTFSGGNAQAQQSTYATLTALVEYEYTPFEEGPAPVPEPSSMFLLGSGILALGYSIKRRKQS